MHAWLYRNFPKAWSRWWSARLIATTACSKWLHAGNPDFTWWQRVKRNSLALALFCSGEPFPVGIRATKGSPVIEAPHDERK